MGRCLACEHAEKPPLGCQGKPCKLLVFACDKLALEKSTLEPEIKVPSSYSVPTHPLLGLNIIVAGEKDMLQYQKQGSDGWIGGQGGFTCYEDMLLGCPSLIFDTLLSLSVILTLNSILFHVISTLLKN